MGIALLEDKIVQQAVVTILNEIYEMDFKGFSYGFRPERSPHQALDALSVGLHRKRVNLVLDADIRGFFDQMSHEWTVKFIEHRVGDPRMVRIATAKIGQPCLIADEWPRKSTNLSEVIGSAASALGWEQTEVDSRTAATCSPAV